MIELRTVQTSFGGSSKSWPGGPYRLKFIGIVMVLGNENVSGISVNFPPCIVNEAIYSAQSMLIKSRYLRK